MKLYDASRNYRKILAAEALIKIKHSDLKELPDEFPVVRVKSTGEMKRCMGFDNLKLLEAEK